MLCVQIAVFLEIPVLHATDATVRQTTQDGMADVAAAATDGSKLKTCFVAKATGLHMPNVDIYLNMSISSY